MAASHSPEELLRNARLDKVKLAKLKSDYSYQRDTNENLVDEIAENWNVVGSELILVADRGPRPADGPVQGGLWIINGQHRTKAAQKIGIEELDARIVDLRKVEDPASLEAHYRLITNRRVNDRATERFKAQVRAGDEDSIAILKILNEANTEVNFVANPDTGINCISTVEAIYKLDDGVLLGWTLKVVNDAWGTIGGANARAAVLKSLAWFIEKHSEESDYGRLVDRLKTIGISAWESRAHTSKLAQGGAMWVNFYKSLIEVYNEHLKRNRLQWKMRGAQVMNERGGGGRGE